MIPPTHPEPEPTAASAKPLHIVSNRSRSLVFAKLNGPALVLRERLARALSSICFTSLLLALCFTANSVQANAATPSNEPKIANTLSAPIYEGGAGVPTPGEIATFKANINDSLKNYPHKYPWGESYIMMSLVEMYKATRDTFFLDKLAEHANAVIAHRDDLLSPQLMDTVRGKVMPAWGSTAYGPRSVYLVHTGMIAYPIAAFVRIILEDSTLHARYKPSADYFLARIRETIDCYDNEGEWIDVDETQGYYYCPQSNILGEGPINGMAAMGRAIIETYLACRDVKYLTRAEKIATRFQNYLIHEPATNSFYWRYWVAELSMEDISHGAIDVDFAALAWRNGIVFTRTDMERFARTLVDVMVREDGYHMFYYVNGSGTTEMSQAASRWLDLTQVDPRTYDLVYEIQVVNGMRTSQQIDYAKLLKWKPSPFKSSFWLLH